MRLANRQAIPDTSPLVHIGKRVYRTRDGEERTCSGWYAQCCFRGKQHHVTLKTKSLSVAIHRAHEFADRVTAAAGQMPSRRRHTMAELARPYLAQLVNRGRASTTVTKYTYTLSVFVAWWQSVMKDRPADEFNEQHFWQWFGQMRTDGFSLKTQNDRAVIVKQLLKWSAKQKLIPSNPIADAKLEDPPPTPQPCFTPEQVNTLLTNADRHERAIFSVMAFAGLRFGECRDLRWTDLMLPSDQPGFIIVQLGGSGPRTKNRKSRRVPIHPELRKVFDSLQRRGERVFYSRPSRRYPAGDHMIGESHLLVSLKRLCRRCGFEKPEQYKVHTFRHVFASMCARSTVAYRYALAWMGHSSSQILDLYYSMFDRDAAAAIRTIDYGLSWESATGDSRPADAPDRSAAGAKTIPFMRLAR